MNDWAEVFDCPIHIHQSDEEWIVDQGKHVSLWDGSEQPLWDGMRIINIGGHFPGSSILHVPSLSQERACVLSGLVSPTRIAEDSTPCMGSDPRPCRSEKRVR